MSAVDHITDDDLKSKDDKIDLITQQLELSKARTEVLLAMLGDNRPDYDTLNEEARKLVNAQTEEPEESHPPRFETILD